jgi:hypothetical protein
LNFFVDFVLFITHLLVIKEYYNLPPLCCNLSVILCLLMYV